jgi:hypothetical protein
MLILLAMKRLSVAIVGITLLWRMQPGGKEVSFSRVTKASIVR